MEASLQTQTSPQAQRPERDFIRPAERVLSARLLTRSGLLAANVRLLHTVNCSFFSALRSPALLLRSSADLHSREKVTLCGLVGNINTGAYLQSRPSAF